MEKVILQAEEKDFRDRRAMHPVTSVIIVNYHSGRLAKRAVDSLFREDEKIEVLLVDNSTSSEERQYLQTAFDNREITLIFNDRNVGFAAACNQAFSASRGEYVFLLNPDAYVVPPCLSVLREFMEAVPAVACASPLLYWDSAMTYLFPSTFLPSPFRDLLMKLSHLLPLFGYLYSQYGREKNIALWKASVPVKTENLSGGTVMVRRSAVEDAGGLFDERFFLFYEDNDLFLRMNKAGYSLYTVPTAKAVHSYSHSTFKLDIMAQSRELYFAKHFGSSFLARTAARLPAFSRQAACVDSGTWKTPPVFPVPPKLKKGYLFEWSTNHLFIPSVGSFGSGETFIFSEELWPSLENGDYYSRFSDDKRMCRPGEVLLWRKAEA